MKKLLGFTLSELMISLAVLGILCAAISPSIINNMPNQNKILMKRAYYSTTNTVKEIINNSYLYRPPEGDISYLGFDYTSSSTYNGKIYSGATKFPEIFIDNLNRKDKSQDLETSTDYCEFKAGDGTSGNISVSNCITVLTTDGMRWTFGVPSTVGQSSWVYNADSIVSYILVDVNTNRKPNCYQGNTSTSCKNRTKNFDQFRIIVYTNGRVKVSSEDVWARSVINVNTSINRDE